MVVTLARNLPNPEILGKAVLEAGSGVTCSATVPDNLAAKLPHYTLFRTGGAATHPKFIDRATMQLISWGPTYVMARELAETARVLFFDAWRSQWSTADGVIHRIDELVAPGEFRTEGQPDGVFRFDSTWTFWTRPAQTG